MKVLITGGGGFLGMQLCKSLLHPDCKGLRRLGTVEPVSEIVLFDVPGAFDSVPGLPTDPRVRCVTGSIECPETLGRLIDTPGMSVFHLAGIMSGQGEKDFDLCLKVNFEGTRNVLESCRALAQSGERLAKVVFASSGATFGETEECPVSDTTKIVPLNTYGMTKAMGEMLVNDYTRKGFLDGCSARLPTVIVRPGKPNAATTSCYSGVIREPLNGIDVELPVARNLPHAVSSARALITNLRALHDAEFGKPGQAPVDRALTLPSISITLQVLVDALHRVVPKAQHSKLGRISDRPDPFLSGVVGKMGCRDMTHGRALSLGLVEVPSVETMIIEYIQDFGQDSVISLESTTEGPVAKRARVQPQKVAVITGAGSGVGRAAAIALAQSFTALVLAGRRREAAEATAGAVRAASQGAEVLVVPCDVTKATDVQRLFNATVERFGRCDLLFNNAGVGAPAVSLEQVPLAAWRQCVDTNLTGMFLCTQEAFKVMKSQTPRGGRIINNGSISADRPRVHSAAYTAAKHGVSGLTKSTALDGRAYDIACGQIDIGNARTDMSERLQEGALQPTMDGSERKLPEPLMCVDNVARAVEYMASLPLDANVLNMTVMATKMPLVGRG